MGAALAVCKGDTEFVTLLQCLVMIVAVGMGVISQDVLMHLPRIGSALRMQVAHKAQLMW
jgi:hypothetical protein